MKAVFCFHGNTFSLAFYILIFPHKLSLEPPAGKEG